MARPGRQLGLSTLVGLWLVVVGLLVGSGPLSDNSFLTHLATGRRFWDGDGLPHVDPYTFTASGEHWVVQSWGASVLYGFVDRFTGLAGLRLVTALSMGVLVGIAWILTRPGSTLVARLLTMAPFVVVGIGTWNERPFLFALCWLAVALALATESISLPVTVLGAVGWLWANTHGSWPLGLVALAALALGARLDGVESRVPARALWWLAFGCAAGAVNPYGPEILVFPVQLLGRRDVLRNVIEWQAPRFESAEELAFLVLLVVVLIGLARSASWRATLLAVVFVPLALLSARNLPVAAIALLPGTAASLRGLGSIPGDRPVGLGRAGAVVAGLIGALVLVRIPATDDFDDRPFPVGADRWLHANGLGPAEARIVTHDYVGNWWEARFLGRARVFIDDRVEVLPERVADDYVSLLRGEPGWQERLDRYEPDAVLWERDRPLAQLLELAPDWELAFEDGDFQVFVPAGH